MLLCIIYTPCYPWDVMKINLQCHFIKRNFKFALSCLLIGNDLIIRRKKRRWKIGPQTWGSLLSTHLCNKHKENLSLMDRPRSDFVVSLNMLLRLLCKLAYPKVGSFSFLFFPLLQLSLSLCLLWIFTFGEGNIYNGCNSFLLQRQYLTFYCVPQKAKTT